MLWSKQFYHYDVERWLEGDPAQPARRPSALAGPQPRLDAPVQRRDVISMPDKWEYPWFAAWDLAFHCVALALVDPQFAKEQLVLMLREWYMHPNGQIPAYEWDFGDVNPPVLAMAARRASSRSSAAARAWPTTASSSASSTSCCSTSPGG